MRNERPRRRKIKARRWYVRPWIVERPLYGHYHQLLANLNDQDPETYRYYLRMDRPLFMDILSRIEHRIRRQDTNFKMSLEPGLRLAITLRFLATGEAYRSLSIAFRVSANAISLLVPETCEAIIQEYMEEVLICPSTPEGWRAVAQEFGQMWNFHHTIGALDGKHIAIQPPPNSGSYYFNYKGYHSIILLALVDARGKFMYVDVGANGSCSDGGVFQHSQLRTALETGAAGLPPSDCLPGDNAPMPYFIIGDDAFPHRDWLQKPYPHRGLTPAKRDYNYRLSRARRIVENAFGMWANRFRVFLTTINVKPESVVKMVVASCILHNILRDRRPHTYAVPVHDARVPEGDWTRDPLDGLQPRARQSGPAAAKLIRDQLANYYARPPNRLPWQRN